MPESDQNSSLPSKTIGWREWLCLPELGVEAVKAKIDTGARTSSLHATHIKQFERAGKKWVRFDVHPLQKSTRVCIQAEAEVLEFREIRSSSGHSDRRPVIVTMVAWNGQSWPVELTLASRDKMGFRMLLGREAVRGRFAVDAGSSWYGGRPSKAVRNPVATGQSAVGQSTVGQSTVGQSAVANIDLNKDDEDDSDDTDS